VVAYTGAGISTSSGIGDYATQSEKTTVKQPKIRDPFDAQPTPAHRVLSAMFHSNLLHHWVQQNHDGLPQKAGFPPENLNEIHGACYDPSNPVVPMSGSLRSDLFKGMIEWERKADLVLALGTSLCGMNADRLVTTVSSKAASGKALGSVIVSLQRTVHDDTASLRIFATLDDVFIRLAKELGLELPPPKSYVPSYPKEAEVALDVFSVPYDRNGRLSTRDERLTWSLKPGSRVRVTQGPGEGFEGEMQKKRDDGHYVVQLPCIREGDPRHGKGFVSYVLGSWWVQSAAAGLAPVLPIVNV